ncbi:MAG: 23S rRNA pseudouridine2605 synthase [Candidatus Saccharimonadales bacterium]|jgi:23S rRNA pseudouridine2605 synthase
MRLNKFIALHTDLSRRKADEAITLGRVMVNDQMPAQGENVSEDSKVQIDGVLIEHAASDAITLLVNKPEGYISSKDGQGSKTVYDLIPDEFKTLNIAGRLDKDSSGLMILTSDGLLLNELTHPSNNKQKLYEVTVDHSIRPTHLNKIQSGVDIGEKRLSKMHIEQIDGNKYSVKLSEGRNRQIRRTLSGLGYKVVTLHRVQIGPYSIESLSENTFITL